MDGGMLFRTGLLLGWAWVDLYTDYTLIAAIGTWL